MKYKVRDKGKWYGENDRDLGRKTHSVFIHSQLSCKIHKSHTAKQKKKSLNQKQDEKKLCFPLAQNPRIITPIENVKSNLFCNCQVAWGRFAA